MYIDIYIDNFRIYVCVCVRICDMGSFYIWYSVRFIMLQWFMRKIHGVYVVSVW